MYAGMAYIIHDKQFFDKNKRKVKAMLSGKNRWQNNICDASVVEFRGKHFLIIDGYTGILDPNEKFAQNLRKITCPRYEKEKKRLDSVEWVNDMISNFWDLSDEEMDKTFFHNPAFEDAKESLKQAYDLMQEIGRFKLLGNRDDMFYGIMYGEDMVYTGTMFDVSKEEAERVLKDVFKATTQKENAGDVIFLETLYQMKI